MTINRLQGIHERQTSVCIVGAGIAGILAAAELGKLGVPTVLLESGEQTSTESVNSSDLNELDHNSNDFSTATSGRSRGLGGTSALWGGRLLPLMQAEVGPRPHLGLSGWPIDLTQVLDRHGPAVEAAFGLPSDSFSDAPSRPQSTILRSDPEVAVRYPKWAPFNRCNLGTHFADELSASTKVEVLLNATATGFKLTPSGRLDAITARSVEGGEVIVRAKEFVISCGTIETTRLLLLLNRFGDDRVFPEGAGLGRYLQEHLGTVAASLTLNDRKKANALFGYRFQGGARRNPHFETTLAAQERGGVGASFAQVIASAPPDTATATIKRLMRSRQGGDRPSNRELARLMGAMPELFRGASSKAFRKLHHWPGYTEAALHVWIEQLPSRHNAIALGDDVDAMGVPKPLVHWTAGEHEERTFDHGVAAVRDYWARNHLNPIATPVWNETQGSRRWSSNAAMLYHPSGTARMGVAPDESVVDSDLTCHAVRNLTVLSAAVFPSAGATGPTFTLGALALASAERIGATKGMRR